MSLEEEKNKALARRLLEVLFANGDLDTLDEVLAPTLSTAACYLVSCGGGQAPSPTKSTAGLSGWRATAWVSPPLSCNPAGSRRGLVFEREPVAWVKRQEAPLSIL